MSSGSGAAQFRSAVSEAAARRASASKWNATTLWFTASSTFLLWLNVAVAAAALWPIYQSFQIIIVIAVAVLAGSAIAILGARFRWSSLTVLISTLVAFFSVGVPLAVPSSVAFGFLPTPEGEFRLLRATALGWKQLLTITLPVGEYRTLLVPALVLVLAATVIGLSVGLRSRIGEFGILAPVLLFLVGTAFGPASAQSSPGLALTLLATSFAWLAWQRWYRRRASMRLLQARTMGTARPPGSAHNSAVRRSAEVAVADGLGGVRTILRASLIVLAAAAVAVLAVTSFPPTAERRVLRSAIEQPFDSRDYPSPLSGFRAYLEPGRANETMLTVTGLPDGARLRLATLDTYNGIIYSVGSADVGGESGAFITVPSTFDQSKSVGKPVAVTITVDNYFGHWLPTVGNFVGVRFAGADEKLLRQSVYYNDSTSTAALISDLHRGVRYDLSAIEPRQPTASQLSTVRPGAAATPRITLLPDYLVSTLDGWVRSASTPGTRLVEMIAAMKKNGYVSHGISPADPPSRSGHSANRITELVTDQIMIGDQEQYAVTAALMAHAIGFPARVVVGFVPAPASGAGALTIHGSDISAWIEVNTAQFGWVTIDPTPQVRTIPEELPREPTAVSQPQSPVQAPAQEPPGQTSQLPPNSADNQTVPVDQAGATARLVLRVVGWSSLALLALVAPFLVIIAAKVRRRVLRRRATSAVDRIRGGWQEFQDCARDHGYLTATNQTRQEVAAVVGWPSSAVVATMADRAVFSPDEPAQEQADEVWVAVMQLRAALDAGRSRRERFRAAVSLRSLQARPGRSRWRGAARRARMARGDRDG